MKRTASDSAPAATATIRDGQDDRRARAVEMYLAGDSTREVGATLGVAGSTIERWLELEGVERRRRGPRVNTTQQIAIARRRQRVAELYAGGMTGDDVAALVGISRPQVYVDLQAVGVERRPPGQPVLYPEHVGARTCAYCGKEFTAKPSRVARGYGETCSNRCKTLRRWWVTGDGVSVVMLRNASALAGRNLTAAFKSRWSGKSGRPKSLDPTKVETARRLAAKGYSERAIAEATGLSKSSVHRLVQNPR